MMQRTQCLTVRQSALQISAVPRETKRHNTTPYNTIQDIQMHKMYTQHPQATLADMHKKAVDSQHVIQEALVTNRSSHLMNHQGAINLRRCRVLMLANVQAHYLNLNCLVVRLPW